MSPGDAIDWVVEKIMCGIFRAHQPVRYITWTKPYYDRICRRCGKLGHVDTTGKMF